MNTRLAKKIQKQINPPEAIDKISAYWDRYNRAWLYSQRLYRRLLRKMRKEGRYIWFDTELNRIRVGLNAKNHDNGVRAWGIQYDSF